VGWSGFWLAVAATSILFFRNEAQGFAEALRTGAKLGNDTIGVVVLAFERVSLQLQERHPLLNDDSDMLSAFVICGCADQLPKRRAKGVILFGVVAHRHVENPCSDQ